MLAIWSLAPLPFLKPKSWLIWKDPDAGKDWGQEEKGMTEEEMVGWHHRLSGHGFGWTPGVGDGQGGLACCSSWGHKESDMTEQLNWTDAHLCVYYSSAWAVVFKAPQVMFVWLESLMWSLGIGIINHWLCNTPVSEFRWCHLSLPY